MLDTDPEFDGHVALLSEAGRLRPEFGVRVLEATSDAEIDLLVEEARTIVDDAASQAWI